MTKLIPSAVLIPIILRRTQPTVLFTLRSQELSDHAGQISFPGGRWDEGDSDLIATALREAREEVSIHSSQVSILYCLPDYHTVTGYCITPVVGIVRTPLQLRCNPKEVTTVFEVPLRYLLDVRHYIRKTIIHKGQERFFWVLSWRGNCIWGATAAMLLCLCNYMADKKFLRSKVSIPFTH